MFKYFSLTEKDIKEMLEKLNLNDISELFSDIPNEAIYKEDIDIPSSLSELELRNKIKDIKSKNKILKCFLGAGSYDVYTPSVVNTIINRQEFKTSYTPYQAEISQGTLQYIFEFQSMICELTGLDVSNASMYDGATATAETIYMASSQTRRNKVLISKTMNPSIIDVVKTYAKFRNIEIDYIDVCDYQTSIEDIKNKLDNTVAAVIVQNPNFYGYIEDYQNISEVIHNNKSLFVMNCDPQSLSLIKTPKELGCDICCGDCQSLGLPMSFGGPYVGYLATVKNLVRKLPGRIVGMTNDSKGERGYVLTLQAREQHIRREKANSNICSNQSLMALAATVYTSVMGKEGLTEVSTSCFNNSHYLMDKLLETKLFTKVTNKEFFKEFLLQGQDLDGLNKYLLDNGYLGGLVIDNLYLLCATETKSEEDILEFVQKVVSYYVR